MLTLTRPALAAALALLWAGVASAIPVTFTLESSTMFDAMFASSSTFTPALPFSGGGDVDEALGTFTFTLPDFVTDVDVFATGPGSDGVITTTGWSQTGTFAGGVGGAVTSIATGSSNCVGGLVCGGTWPQPVPAWPPTGASGPTLGAPSASISLADGPGYDGTITVVNGFDSAGGQNQSIYRYSLVPEPGTVLLLAMGLTGLAATGRRA
jgi:hypothetical protein